MDDKTNAAPSGKQLKIPYPSVRGNELQDLKDARLGDPYSRLILLILDLYINQELGFWDLSHKELMKACELSRTVYYDRIRQLKELCLISVDDLDDSTKKRFRIIRSNVAENACHHRQAGIKAKGARSNRKANLCPLGEQPVPLTDGTVPDANQTVPLADSSVLNTDQTVPNTDVSILLKSTVNNRPSTATLPGTATAADVILEMIACGVDFPTEAVERAISRGCVPCELAEIVRHFRSVSNRHGWEAGALQRRIANHSPGMPLDAGWPPMKSRAIPPMDLEAKFGPLLDALTESQIADLVKRHGTGTMQRIREMSSAVSMARSEQWRPHLLRILQSLEDGQ